MSTNNLQVKKGASKSVNDVFVAVKKDVAQCTGTTEHGTTTVGHTNDASGSVNDASGRVNDASLTGNDAVQSGDASEPAPDAVKHGVGDLDASKSVTDAQKSEPGDKPQERPYTQADLNRAKKPQLIAMVRRQITRWPSDHAEPHNVTVAILKSVLLSENYGFTMTLASPEVSKVLSKSKAPATRTTTFQKERAVEEAQRTGTIKTSPLYERMSSDNGPIPDVSRPFRGAAAPAQQRKDKDSVCTKNAKTAHEAKPAEELPQTQHGMNATTAAAMHSMNNVDGQAVNMALDDVNPEAKKLDVAKRDTNTGSTAGERSSDRTKLDNKTPSSAPTSLNGVKASESEPDNDMASGANDRSFNDMKPDVNKPHVDEKSSSGIDGISLGSINLSQSLSAQPIVGTTDTKEESDEARKAQIALEMAAASMHVRPFGEPEPVSEPFDFNLSDLHSNLRVYLHDERTDERVVFTIKVIVAGNETPGQQQCAGTMEVLRAIQESAHAIQGSVKVWTSDIYNPIYKELVLGMSGDSPLVETPPQSSTLFFTSLCLHLSVTDATGVATMGGSGTTGKRARSPSVRLPAATPAGSSPSDVKAEDNSAVDTTVPAAKRSKSATKVPKSKEGRQDYAKRTVRWLQEMVNATEEGKAFKTAKVRQLANSALAAHWTYAVTFGETYIGGYADITGPYTRTVKKTDICEALGMSKTQYNNIERSVRMIRRFTQGPSANAAFMARLASTEVEGSVLFMEYVLSHE